MRRTEPQGLEKAKPKLQLIDFINRDPNLKRLAIICVLTFVIMGLLAPGSFLTMRNLRSMAFQFPEYGLLSIAILLAMLTGGIDLSVVGIANLSSILAALLLTRFGSELSGVGELLLILGAILVALITGLVGGALNGVLISRIGITPILATLGTMELFTGIGVVITKGTAVFGFPDRFVFIGNGTILGIPVPFLIFIVFAVIFSFLLRRTPFGFKLFMLGSNPTASQFSGIDKKEILVKTYVLTGILAACAGIVLMARTASAKADYGTSYTLQAILVAILGGTNPAGGFGTVIGVVLAVFSLQFLSSGFNHLQISNFAKDFVWGGLLLLVMAFNYIMNMRSERKKRESQLIGG